MKQYISIDAGEPIKQRLIYYWIPNQRLLITQNNEPVGTLNRDQIIVALSEKGEKCCNSFCHEQKLNLSGRGNTFRKYLRIGLQNKTNLMLVMENNELVGTLDTENLLEFLLIKGPSPKCEFLLIITLLF
jgi:hypothetical protein